MDSFVDMARMLIENETVKKTVTDSAKFFFTEPNTATIDLLPPTIAFILGILVLIAVISYLSQLPDNSYVSTSGYGHSKMGGAGYSRPTDEYSFQNSGFSSSGPEYRSFPDNDLMDSVKMTNNRDQYGGFSNLNIQSQPAVTSHNNVGLIN